MVDSLNGLYTHVYPRLRHCQMAGDQGFASMRWWPEDFPGDFSQQCSKSTLFQGLWMCAWMHAHVLAGSLLCDLLSWLITHLGSALPSCFTTLFPFWKNSSIFCSSNDVAGKPNCHLCFVKGQHHRMLNALAWFGQGYEHRCCQWKKSVSATVFGHHRDQWHMTYSNYSLLFIPLCYPLILFNRMHYLCPSLDSL